MLNGGQSLLKRLLVMHGAEEGVGLCNSLQPTPDSELNLRMRDAPVLH